MKRINELASQAVNKVSINSTGHGVFADIFGKFKLKENAVLFCTEEMCEDILTSLEKSFEGGSMDKNLPDKFHYQGFVHDVYFTVGDRLLFVVTKPGLEHNVIVPSEREFQPNECIVVNYVKE